MVQYLKKLMSLFYKDYPDKPTATFEAIETVSLMTRLTIKSVAKSTTEPVKQKQCQPANSANK